MIFCKSAKNKPNVSPHPDSGTNMHPVSAAGLLLMVHHCINSGTTASSELLQCYDSKTGTQQDLVPCTETQRLV